MSAVYRNVRCFIPGSLLSYRYVDDMSTYEGRELEVVVEDLTEKARGWFFPGRLLKPQKEKKKKELMKQLQEGEMRQELLRN